MDGASVLKWVVLLCCILITWSKDMSVISEKLLLDMWVRLGAAAAGGRSKHRFKGKKKKINSVFPPQYPKPNIKHLQPLSLHLYHNRHWLKYLLRSSCPCSSVTSGCRSAPPGIWCHPSGSGGSRRSWPGQQSGRRPAGSRRPPCRRDWSHFYMEMSTEGNRNKQPCDKEDHFIVKLNEKEKRNNNNIDK